MARTVNVILDVADKAYDLNKMGLVSLNFDRIIAGDRNTVHQALANLDIVMFDSTGRTMLSILQQSDSKIRFKYGFNDELSDVYTLNVLKIKTTYNNLGCMVGIKAVAVTPRPNMGAAYYKVGTPIRDVLIDLAARNGWYIGPKILDEAGRVNYNNIKPYIDVDTQLADNLTKPADMEDFAFIEQILIPIANSSVTSKTATHTTFFDVRLVIESGLPTLYFRKLTDRTTTRRVWQYTYGTSTDNSILNITNEIDWSYIIEGLSIEIPLTPEERALYNSTDKVTRLLQSKFDYVEAKMKKLSLPIPNVNDFMWNVTVVNAEDVGYKTPEQAIEDTINKIMQNINTIEMEVIGNPRIRVTDAISLDIKLRDGSSSPLAAGGTSIWRVVSITESIGLDGYSTHLKLTRENL